MAFGVIGTVVQAISAVIVKACSATEKVVASVDNLASVLELETGVTKSESFLESEEKRMRIDHQLAQLRKQLASELEETKE